MGWLYVAIYPTICMNKSANYTPQYLHANTIAVAILKNIAETGMHSYIV